MKGSAREYLERNIWVSADPTEPILPAVIDLLGDRKFFMASDYPHVEGVVDPVGETHEAFAGRPEALIERVLSSNAAAFFGL